MLKRMLQERRPAEIGVTSRTSQAVGARLAARLERFHVLHGFHKYRGGLAEGQPCSPTNVCVVPARLAHMSACPEIIPAGSYAVAACSGWFQSIYTGLSLFGALLGAPPTPSSFRALVLALQHSVREAAHGY